MCSYCIQGAFQDNYPRLSAFGFCRKIALTKPNKAQTKRENIMVQYNSWGSTVSGVNFVLYFLLIYICDNSHLPHQQVVVSSTSSFIIYHISSFYPHNFAPNFPFLHPPPPPTEHDSPSAQAGLRFCTTTSPPKRQQGQPKILMLPANDNISTQLPQFHRQNSCL